MAHKINDKNRNGNLTRRPVALIKPVVHTAILKRS